jgi:Domain of unknown function (DUF4158)
VCEAAQIPRSTCRCPGTPLAASSATRVCRESIDFSTVTLRGQADRYDHVAGGLPGCRGSSNSGTACGVSELTRADLPPFSVPSRAGLRWRGVCNGSVAVCWLLAWRSCLCGACRWGFLADDEAAAYGRYAEVPSRVDLERVFFFDDEDLRLTECRRGEHMKLRMPLMVGPRLHPLGVPLTCSRSPKPADHRQLRLHPAQQLARQRRRARAAAPVFPHLSAFLYGL